MPEALDIARRADLAGKVALVTGGSSGLGAETVRALALAGADVIFTARNLDAGTEVLRTVGEAGKGRATLLPLDLSDFADVERFAGALDVPAIDLLIANAGVSETPAERQADGLDTRFATNHLGHFLLVHRLFDRLSARGARIVMLSSAGHKGRPVRLDDLGWRRREIQHRVAYGESKSANILFAVEATRRWHDRGVFANAVLPGSIMTGLQRHHSPERLAEMNAIGGVGTAGSVFGTVGQGAATSVWAVVAPELDRVGGLVLEDCGLCRVAGPGTHAWRGYELHATDSETARALWTASAAMLGELGHAIET
ncbi:SDR family NAD(P)-dependent oxidoreductase [Rhizorhabdus wittichii]|uniref:SDR family NAD(P)-dependent oxidoreductase n=1 Tax=Rhizorhabdus wittichii TaxID=160791 RepID=A0A975HDD7_9SPHN|nr:SDR family NAD(P)-dependent oxidoreductase [Rhizorhabdus wittichii]QTH21163.1 SDR family NAD(P)-dependent oxidoreductase [Rhizorhabdus wittichii]